jgi:hypothetical protein
MVICGRAICQVWERLGFGRCGCTAFRAFCLSCLQRNHVTGDPVPQSLGRGSNELVYGLLVRFPLASKMIRKPS